MNLFQSWYFVAMKHENGILRSIFGNSWSIDTGRGSLKYRNQENSGVLNYLEIEEVRVVRGLVSDRVTIKHKNGRVILNDFSETGANELFQDILQKTKVAIAEQLSNHLEELEDLNTAIENFLSENRYIAQSDIRRWASSFPIVGEYISNPYFEPQLLESDLRDNLTLLSDIREPSSVTLRERNETFIKNEIQNYSKLFDKLEQFPLSEEQKRAAVTDEDRNLLIAAAGAGKTSTIIAKAIYLVESRLAKPQEILILAYNKDAQVEIEERLSKAFPKIRARKQKPVSKTYHGYGLEVIGRATGQKPRIAEIAQASDRTLRSIFSKLISELAAKNGLFFSTWLQYITTAKQPLPDIEKIQSMTDYERLLEQMGAERKGGKKSLSFTTINNHEVKSLQELRLFNWLVINGVNFQYERPYEFQTANSSFGQYYPDFYYPEADLYHEHFALDRHGLPPKFMKDYLKGVHWKRSVHRENGTKLIETHSAHFYEQDIFEILKEKLEEYGVTFRPLKKSRLDELIEKSFDVSYDASIFITFLRHFKANNFTFAELGKRFSSSVDKYRSSLFLTLFEAIYVEYQNRLENADEIDFEDQINKAASYFEESQIEHKWKYVLVDEFQDISQDRKRLLDAILSQNDYVKLFAVGDDWQSIYRFAGADVDIITNFSKHFGATAQNYLTKTFRSYQGLIDVAGNFIQKNPAQLTKTVISTKTNIEADQVVIKEYLNKQDQNNQFQKILIGIANISKLKKTQLSVLVLARYSHQLPENKKHIQKHFSSLEIDFKTIHRSKGLEADYMVLLNLSNEKYGFPSLIEDDPLIKLVIPKSDDFPHSEERRLLYVAITRAKRGAFLLSRMGKQSDFISELVKMNGVQPPDSLKKQRDIPTENNSSCPRCEDGTLQIRVDKAGKYRPFLGCSNFPNCRFVRKSTVCPKCSVGSLVRLLNSKTNKPFYPCNNPKCSYVFKTYAPKNRRK